MRALVGLMLLVLSGLALAEEDCGVRVGEYSGRVKAEWLTKTREMRLLEDFAFKDPNCKIWAVPKGAIVDGASIPRALWSIMGGPFDGPYRDGSVIHDYYCKVRTAPSEEVHEMFYHALRANGVDSNVASLMFYAVRWFGPRWQLLKKIGSTDDFDSFAVVYSAKQEFLEEQIVDQIARASGQPSPNASPLRQGSKFLARNASETSGSKWLVKDGFEVDHAGEIALPAAFERSQRKYLSEQFRQGKEVFVISGLGGVSFEPTPGDLERIKNWIDAARPTLATLRTTAPTSVPR